MTPNTSRIRRAAPTSNPWKVPMFTEMLQAEVWRKKLEQAGYKVVPDAWEPEAQEFSSEPGERRTHPGRMSSPDAAHP